MRRYLVGPLQLINGGTGSQDDVEDRNSGAIRSSAVHSTSQRRKRGLVIIGRQKSRRVWKGFTSA